MTRRVPSNWPAVRFAVFKRDGFRCQYCGDVPGEGSWLEPDHIVPVSRRGSDHPSNLITACNGCNFAKGDRYGLPRPLCVGELADGWTAWKRWGKWVLAFTRDMMVLSFDPDGLDYWISIERVHEGDWESHIALKPWARTVRFWHPVRAGALIDAPAPSPARRRWIVPLEEFMGDEEPAEEVLEDHAPEPPRKPWRRCDEILDGIYEKAEMLRRLEPNAHRGEYLGRYLRPPGQAFYDFADAIAFCRLLVRPPEFG